MARGHRRWSIRRKESSKKAAGVPAPGRRGLAASALAMGGCAASLLTPAQAVTLGDVSLQSALGQPLNARIPVQLGPGEMLGSACVSIPTPARSDLGALPQPQVTVPEAPGGSISLHVTTTQPLYEPMYELQVQLRCAGTPLLVRQYVLMLDLPGTVPAAATPAAAEPLPQPAATTGTTVDLPAAPAARSNRAPRPRPQAATGAAIPSGSRYRVVAGDTLSTIAARVGGGHGVWRLADQIFVANPAAFIGGNPDLIKLGSEIVIPAPATDASLAAGTSTSAAPAAAVAPAPAAAPPAAATVTDASVPEAPRAPASAATTSTDPAAAADTTTTTVAAGSTGAAAPVFADEQPPAAQPQAAAGTPAAAAAPPAAPERNGAPPWLAALIGVLIGAAVSLALLRDRLTGALASLLKPRQPVIEPIASAVATAMPDARATPRFTRPQPAPEPSMVVEEHHHEEFELDPLARTDDAVTVEQPARVETTAEIPAAGAERDLASLFSEPDLPLFEAAVDALPSAEDLDLDLSAASSDATVDQDISWLGDDTSLTTIPKPVIDAAGNTAETVENMDLQTLSQRAGDDAISQTLKDALNLLESDYEDELTASQVVDRKQLNRLLDESGIEDTMVRTGTDQLPRRR
jgi:hypothetical protein